MLRIDFCFFHLFLLDEQVLIDDDTNGMNEGDVQSKSSEFSKNLNTPVKATLKERRRILTGIGKSRHFEVVIRSLCRMTKFLYRPNLRLFEVF